MVSENYRQYLCGTVRQYSSKQKKYLKNKFQEKRILDEKLVEDLNIDIPDTCESRVEMPKTVGLE